MRRFLIYLTTLCLSTPMWGAATGAISVDNEDGVTLYYLITSDNTVEVSYQNTSVSRQYSGAINVPASINYGGTVYTVTGVGEQAFYNGSNVTAITLPETITYIGPRAFYGFTNENIATIGLPEGLESIGYRAFYNDSNLTSLVLPDGVSHVGAEAFNGCSNLSSINIPDAMSEITVRMFYGSSITSLEISGGITTIGGSAFRGCEKLTHIELPKTITHLGDSIFYGCTALETAILDEDMEITTIPHMTFCNCKALEEISIPKNVTTLSGRAFYDCETLSAIDLSENITFIGDSVFYSCSSLKEIEIPSSITSIGSCLFHGCTSLATIKLHDDITHIGSYAFYECPITEFTFPKSFADNEIASSTFYKCQFTEIDLPSHITSIGSSAFEYCPLKSITIPAGVTEMGATALAYCSDLATITFEDNFTLTTLGNGVFRACTSLYEITLPGSLEKVGYNLFHTCTNLESVTFLSPTPPTSDTNEFYDDLEVTMYVPAGTYAVYEASGWHDFETSNNITIQELDYAVIRIVVSSGNVGYATYYNEDYDVTMPEGVTAYTITDVSEEGVATLQAVSGALPAGTAVLLRGSLADYNNVNVTKSSASASADNMLYGSSIDGRTSAPDDGEYYFYKLTTQNGENLGFYWGTDNGGEFTISANKAWLAVPQEIFATLSHRSLSLKFVDDDTTGITAIETENEKVVEGIYTLQGVSVSDMSQKGVYIMNGKKILVK